MSASRIVNQDWLGLALAVGTVAQSGGMLVLLFGGRSTWALAVAVLGFATIAGCWARTFSQSRA